MTQVVILNENITPGCTKTYATYDRAVTAAVKFAESISPNGKFYVTIATFGARFTPVFNVTKEQVVLSSAIASNGFMVVRA